MPNFKAVRSFRFLVGLFVASAGCLGAEPPRNLLVIQTDEHHFSTLGCYGGQIVETPNIDWLANHGAKCTSFYASTPVCSPSRASLVSGLYPHKTGVTSNNLPLHDTVVTFAELLRRQGYATGYAGKWHLDGDGKPQWAPRRKFGFEDNRFMFNRGHWKKFEDTPNGPRVASRNAKGQPTYGVDGADETSFSTDWLCQKAQAFIEANKDQSFCYMVSLPDPHGPNTVRPPYDTMYQDVEVPLPKTLRRKPEQIPSWGRPDNVRPGQLRKLMRQYYGMVKCIDDNVGKILSTLRRLDLLENTMIVLTSDHGDLCGEHGRLNKGVPYEGSARIPFIVYCSGTIAPQTVIHEALTCTDFLPTAMTLLGHEVKHEVDGRDATPLFTGKRIAWRDIAFVRSTAGRNPWISVLTKDFKLVFSTQEVPWLFDVRNDPSELNNLFDSAAHQPIVRQLASALIQYGREHQDPHLRVPKIRAQLIKYE